MPRARRRDPERGAGSGHANEPRVVLPGVSWCPFCKPIVNKKFTSYVCQQHPIYCYYKVARREALYGTRLGLVHDR